MHAYQNIHNIKLVTILLIPTVVVAIWLIAPSGNGKKRNYEIFDKIVEHLLRYKKNDRDYTLSRKKLKQIDKKEYTSKYKAENRRIKNLEKEKKENAKRIKKQKRKNK